MKCSDHVNWLGSPKEEIWVNSAHILLHSAVRHRYFHVHFHEFAFERDLHLWFSTAIRHSLVEFGTLLLIRVWFITGDWRKITTADRQRSLIASAPLVLAFQYLSPTVPPFTAYSQRLTVYNLHLPVCRTSEANAAAHTANSRSVTQFRYSGFTISGSAICFGILVCIGI
jgi:hypothetical protein